MIGWVSRGGRWLKCDSAGAISFAVAHTHTVGNTVVVIAKPKPVLVVLPTGTNMSVILADVLGSLWVTGGG